MSDRPAQTPRQHTRRIEFDNRREYAVFDDRGIALDSDETFPTVEAARGELEFRRAQGDLELGRTYRLLWRPVPREWQVLPGEEVRGGRD